MKKFVYLVVFFFVFTAFTVRANEVYIVGEVRTWNTENGQSRAKLIDVSEDGQTVTLRKTDSKDINIALETLSQADREYVSKQKADFRWASADGFKVTLRMKDGKQRELPLTELTKTSQGVIRKRQVENKSAGDKKTAERIQESGEQKIFERWLEQLNEELRILERKLTRSRQAEARRQAAIANAKRIVELCAREAAGLSPGATEHEVISLHGRLDRDHRSFTIMRNSVEVKSAKYNVYEAFVLDNSGIDSTGEGHDRVSCPTRLIGTITYYIANGKVVEVVKNY